MPLQHSVETNSSAEVDTAALGLAGSLLKVLPEVVGTVDLEAGPSRSQNVGEDRGSRRRNRHTHRPYPEGHECGLFMLGVVDSAQE